MAVATIGDPVDDDEGDLGLVMVIGGSPAKHKLGDISRESDDLFVVERREGDLVIGHWLEGYGMIGVEVRAEHTRKLTPEEADAWHGATMGINGAPRGELTIRPSEVEGEWTPKDVCPQPPCDHSAAPPTGDSTDPGR